MVTGGLAVVAAGPFFDGSALPMVASIAFCGLAVLVVSSLTLRRRRLA
jgi:DHA1 family bicyclomycin/chloramphenicol resistance-like MFS transporter